MSLLVTTIAIVVGALLLIGLFRFIIEIIESIVAFLLGIATVGAVIALIAVILHIIF